MKFLVIALLLTMSPLSYALKFSNFISRKSNCSTQTRLFSVNISNLVDKAIASNDVMVFSKTYCPYCTKGINYNEENFVH